MRSFETIEELRLALLEFKKTYIEQWMLEKYGCRRPGPSATRSSRPGRGSIGTNTVKPLSKNPEAVQARRQECELRRNQDGAANWEARDALLPRIQV